MSAADPTAHPAGESETGRPNSDGPPIGRSFNPGYSQPGSAFNSGYLKIRQNNAGS